MTFFICLLAFFFVPLQIAIASPVAVAAVNPESPFLMRKPLNFHRIAHAKPVNKDAKALNQFLHELAAVVQILYPDFAKTMNYSMIITKLVGDQTQIDLSMNLQKNENESAAAWINEIVMTKEAIEKEKDTKWADLLRELRQIMDKAMRAFEESANSEQIGKKKKIEEESGKMEELKNEITEVIVKLAALDNISKAEIMEPLGKKIDQKRMLKEIAQLWNDLKLEFKQTEDQKVNEESNNHKRTKRMLKLIMHFPIEGESCRRRRRGEDTSDTIPHSKLPMFLGIVVPSAVVIVLIIICLACPPKCLRREPSAPVANDGQQLPVFNAQPPPAGQL